MHAPAGAFHRLHARLRNANARDRTTQASSFGKEVGGHDGAAVSGSVERHALQSIMRVRHEGLRALHERDDPARLPAGLVARLRRILFRLQDATHPGSADAPGFRLHPLKGGREGQWSVRVTGNWRVVFRFEAGEVVDVDLIDYH